MCMSVSLCHFFFSILKCIFWTLSKKSMRIHRKSNEARNNNGGNNNNNSQKQSFQVDWFFVVVVLRYWNCFFPNKYICAPSFSCVARAWEWLKNRNKRRKKRSPDFVDNRLLWKRHAQNLFFSLLSVASVFHALNNDPVRRLSAYCNGLPSGYCCSFGWEVVDGLYFFFYPRNIHFCDE